MGRAGAQVKRSKAPRANVALTDSLESRAAEQETEIALPVASSGEPAPQVSAPALTVADLPALIRDARGERLLAGLMVEYFVRHGDVLVLSGWIAGDDTLSACQNSPHSIALFRRQDVEDAFGKVTSSAAGFLAVLDVRGLIEITFLNFRLAAPQADSPKEEFERLCADHQLRLGFLFRALPASSRLRQEVVKRFPAAPADYAAARGHVEQAKGSTHHGGLVVGWTAALPGVELALADAKGDLTGLNDAVRWHRPDIEEAFGTHFGSYSANAGFVKGWHGALEIGGAIKLVGFEAHAAFVLALGRWDQCPLEPTSYARWAFSLPTPPDDFVNRLEFHDGPILESLVKAKLAGRSNARVVINQFGRPPEKPLCSAVVPLYGRYDFMLNQLLAFSEDEFFRNSVDLIYVVDDPRIVPDVARDAPALFEANRVPFRTISYGENRGYAGANNVGVANSRADRLLLLNSDVVPIEPQWLPRMMMPLEATPGVGIVGARLLYPNGSIQHDGMVFQWEPSWRAYINHHPRIGLEPRGGVEAKVQSELAVTAACLVIRKSTFLDVGGFDEGFIIGDFEDSDLCLKVRQSGLDVVCVRDVELVHLERQSLVGVGGGSFRENVTRYNCWRHQKRWQNFIPKLLADWRQRASA